MRLQVLHKQNGSQTSPTIFICHESYPLQKMDVGKSNVDGACRGFAWLSQ
jgi:hypothetical protein